MLAGAPSVFQPSFRSPTRLEAGGNQPTGAHHAQIQLPAVSGFTTAYTEAELIRSGNKFKAHIADKVPITDALSEVQSLCGCVAELDAAVRAGQLSPTCAKVTMLYTLGMAQSILMAVTNGVWQYKIDGKF